MNKLRFILFLFRSTRLIPKYFNSNKITIQNVKNFIQGSYRLYTLQDQPIYIIEQLWYRLSKVNPDCLNNRMCPCSCPLVSKQLADQPCEKNCYPLLMDKTTWATYKEIFNLDMKQIEEFGKTIIEENIDLIP